MFKTRQLKNTISYFINPYISHNQGNHLSYDIA